MDKVQLEVNINRMVHVNYRGKRDILPSLKPPPSHLTSLMHREENKRHAIQPFEPDLDVTPLARSSGTRNALAAGREAAALLAVLSVGKRAGADAEVFSARVHQGAATRGAVGVAGAPAGDELLALAVADVGGSCGVLLQGAGLDGAAAGVVLGAAGVVVVLGAGVVAASAGVVVVVVVGVPTLVAGAAGLEAAALLTSLSLGTDARADTDGGAALGEGRAALGGAVGNAETLPADELNAFAVSDILLAGGVGEVLAA